MPATVARYCGGANSIIYIGAAVVAIVEKKESKNLPPMNAPSVGAVAVTMVPMMTPKQPTNMGSFLPFQSASQMKKEPVI